MAVGRILVIVAIASALLAGCGKAKNEPLPAPPQIIQDQKQALDNAKAVGDTLGKQVEEQKKQIEESTK